MPKCIRSGSKDSKESKGLGLKDPGKWVREVSESEDDDGGKKKKPKRKMLTKVETSLKQSQLKVFRGIEIPFTDEQQGSRGLFTSSSFVQQSLPTCLFNGLRTDKLSSSSTSSANSDPFP